jgi:hypothetical protein
MTTLTLRFIKKVFIVNGPDIAPAKFKSRREAKDWCVQHYPWLAHLRDRGGRIQAKSRAMPRKGPLPRNRLRTPKIKNLAESERGAKLEEAAKQDPRSG